MVHRFYGLGHIWWFRPWFNRLWNRMIQVWNGVCRFGMVYAGLEWFYGFMFMQVSLFRPYGFENGYGFLLLRLWDFSVFVWQIFFEVSNRLWTPNFWRVFVMLYPLLASFVYATGFKFLNYFIAFDLCTLPYCFISFCFYSSFMLSFLLLQYCWFVL